MTTTLARVPMKNPVMCSDRSTFTNAVVTKNTNRITKREEKILTPGDTLPINTHKNVLGLSWELIKTNQIIIKSEWMFVLVRPFQI